jgi:hypothetical protein
MKLENSNQTANVIFFRFARPIVLSAWVFTLAAAVCVGAFLLPQAVRGDGIAIVLELSCLGVIWIGQGSILSMSPIVISSTDISKCLLGIRVCTIRWVEIVAAHKMRQRGFGSRGYSDIYTIRARGFGLIDAFLPNLIHCVQFDGNFIDLRTLLDIINEKSSSNGFPLLVTEPSANWSAVQVERF